MRLGRFLLASGQRHQRMGIPRSSCWRRGEPVAVILSASEYLALRGERPSFIQAARGVRDRLDVASLDIEDDVFEGLRGDTSGRDVSL